MQNLKYINGNGNEINFVSDEICVVDWQGLANVGLSIQSQTIPDTDGSVYIDSLYEDREITLQIAINDNKNLKRRYEIKRELIKMLNAKLGQGYLVYENDFIAKKIKVIPELPIFENKNYNDTGTLKADLTFYANGVYWEDLEETSVELKGGDNVTIQNDGDVETNVNIDYIGFNDNLVLNNISTDTKIDIDSTNKNYIKIKTDKGNKRVSGVEIKVDEKAKNGQCRFVCVAHKLPWEETVYRLYEGFFTKEENGVKTTIKRNFLKMFAFDQRNVLLACDENNLYWADYSQDIEWNKFENVEQYTFSGIQEIDGWASIMSVGTEIYVTYIQENVRYRIFINTRYGVELMGVEPDLECIMQFLNCDETEYQFYINSWSPDINKVSVRLYVNTEERACAYNIPESPKNYRGHRVVFANDLIECYVSFQKYTGGVADGYNTYKITFYEQGEWKDEIWEQVTDRIAVGSEFDINVLHYMLPDGKTLLENRQKQTTKKNWNAIEIKQVSEDEEGKVYLYNARDVVNYVGNTIFNMTETKQLNLTNLIFYKEYYYGYSRKRKIIYQSHNLVEWIPYKTDIPEIHTLCEGLLGIEENRIYDFINNVNFSTTENAKKVALKDGKYYYCTENGMYYYDTEEHSMGISEEINDFIFNGYLIALSETKVYKYISETFESTTYSGEHFRKVIFRDSDNLYMILGDKVYTSYDGQGLIEQEVETPLDIATDKYNKGFVVLTEDKLYFYKDEYILERDNGFLGEIITGKEGTVIVGETLYEVTLQDSLNMMGNLSVDSDLNFNLRVGENIINISGTPRDSIILKYSKKFLGV